MSKLYFLIIGFITGIIFCGIVFYIFQTSNTIIYTTKKDIKLENGIIIPETTKLIKKCTMPEGFDTLILYFNVQGEKVDSIFKQSVDKRRGLVIPYWIE